MACGAYRIDSNTLPIAVAKMTNVDQFIGVRDLLVENLRFCRFYLGLLWSRLKPYQGDSRGTYRSVSGCAQSPIEQILMVELVDCLMSKSTLLETSILLWRVSTIVI